MSEQKQTTESTKAAAPVTFQTASSAAPVRVQLFNSGGATFSVPIINKTSGDTDVVFVQPGGKPKLLPGYSVDAVFASRNPALRVTKVTS